jgi:hypothetical protein
MAKKFKDLAGACWKGYKAVGLKDKNGRKVPNCVPEETQLEEATVSKKDYSWGKMVTVHHGKDVSYPLHPEHQKIVKNLRPSGEHSKAMYKDETGNQVHVTREGDKVHFVSHRTTGSKKTTVDYKHFDESAPAKNTDVSDKSWLKTAGKKPTIKSDLKNFKNFLTGKKETNEEVEISEAAPFKNKDDAVKYAKEKVKTHRDNLDGIEIYAHSGGFDVNHTSNSSGRNSLNKIGAKHLGTIYKEEVEQVEEGWYEKPASAYRRKGDEVRDPTPVAPVPDKKYIKGTPEHKAYKATKKPINGMPTNEEVDREERSDYSISPKSGRKVHKQIVFKNGEEMKEGYVVRYNNPKSEKHGSEKHFDDQDSAQKHADRGNSVDKIGGKYTVHKTNEKGHDMKEELKGNQHKLDKNKNGKLDKQDFKLLRKEDFENGEVETNVKTYKQFLQSIDEIKMADLPSRKVSGRGYGTEYYKKEAEQDIKGYDDEDKPAKPAGEKRGRGRPVGSTSGARQKGSIAKRKGSGVEMTGYPVHLPNFK